LFWQEEDRMWDFSGPKDEGCQYWQRLTKNPKTRTTKTSLAEVKTLFCHSKGKNTKSIDG